MTFNYILKMMLQGIIPCLIIVLGIYSITKYVFRKRLSRFDTIFIFYFVMLLYVTLFRFQFRGDQLFNETNLNINLVPLIETFSLYENDKIVFLYNIFGNMIWFMPMGFGISKLIKCSFSKCVLFALICSITIEGLQWAFLVGTCDIDDVIFNTIGAMIGAYVYRKSRNL
ncbi:MAG: VanZ family protein [Erysipelotrichaceae bacterium]